MSDTPYAWDDEDPGRCPYCKKPWQMVRPGKSQLNCECQDQAPITNAELAALQAEREAPRRAIEQHNDECPTYWKIKLPDAVTR